MLVKVLAFGVVKEIFGNHSIEVEMKGTTIADLKGQLEVRYPRLKELASFFLALNNEYVSGGEEIRERDEIAIIPPVSGG